MKKKSKNTKRDKRIKKKEDTVIDTLVLLAKDDHNINIDCEEVYEGFNEEEIKAVQKNVSNRLVTSLIESKSDCFDMSIKKDREQKSGIYRMVNYFMNETDQTKMLKTLLEIKKNGSKMFEFPEEEKPAMTGN